MPAAWSKLVFKGVIEGSVVFKRRRLVSEVEEGLGEDDSWRDGSTGGNGRLGFGDRCCTWEAISVSRSRSVEGLFASEISVGLLVGVVKLSWVGVFRSGLAAE